MFNNIKKHTKQKLQRNQKIRQKVTHQTLNITFHKIFADISSFY